MDELRAKEDKLGEKNSHDYFNASPAKGSNILPQGRRVSLCWRGRVQ